MRFRRSRPAPATTPAPLSLRTLLVTAEAAARAARTHGLRTVDGLTMLIGQARRAFALFFGAEPPRGRDAELRALLTRRISGS